MSACEGGGGGSSAEIAGLNLAGDPFFYFSNFGPGATQGGSAAEPVKLGVAPRVASAEEPPLVARGVALRTDISFF